MTTSLVDAESVLAIDLGSIYTRALLFDVVEGQYHFIAGGVVPSTANAPFRDVGEGVHLAVERLQTTTGRVLLSPEARLILPSQPNGSGVDRLVVTYSCGPRLKMVTAGLLPDVSLESAQRLAATVYSKVIDSIGLNDRRRPEVQIDAILHAGPDLILLTGGSEYGASRSVFKLVDLLRLVCQILPREKRPEILYAGNSALARRIKESLEKWTPVTLSANLRPSIDVEDLDAAQEALGRVVTRLRTRQIGGLEALAGISSLPPSPGAQGLGRIVRFLSKVYDPLKGVLGVDVGASSTVMAAAIAGKLSLCVTPYGMGSGLPELAAEGHLDEIMQWLPAAVAPAVVRDYLWQKSLYPALIPMSEEILWIEQAAARQALRLAMQQTLAGWPGLKTSFEPVLACGSVLCRAPSPAQSLFMLLDGLQPVGISTLILDQNGLAASLGAIARLNNLLPVQVLESGSFLNLGTVICPLSRARFGSPVLKVRLEYEQGNEAEFEIRQGTITALPLQQGQTAQLHLQPLRGSEIDGGGKRSAGRFKITGGACGAVVDARGRPLILPSDPQRRYELIKKWKLALGE